MSDHERGFFLACLVICERGFENEHAWMAWLNKRRGQIDKLPPPLRKRVMAAHANSGPKDLK